MQLKLKVLQGDKAGQQISIPGPKFLIGRDVDCQLRPRSDLISRHHCVLLVESGYVGVRDFGSKNGTFVNGERISGERQLSQGDELSVGPLHFEVELATKVGGPKKPKVQDVNEAAARTAQMADQEADDVSHWLDDEQIPLASETRAISAEDTNAIRAQADEVPTGETTEMQVDSGQEGEESSDAKSQEPPNSPKKVRFEVPKAKDTQSVAESVLRQFVKQQKEKTS